MNPAFNKKLTEYEIIYFTYPKHDPVLDIQ